MTAGSTLKHGRAAFRLATSVVSVAVLTSQAGAGGFSLQEASSATAAPVSLFPGGRLQLQEGPVTPAAAPAAPSGRGRYALSMGLSALVPGTGEIVSGHFWNGIPLLAADVATWIGYFHYEDEGDQWKGSYEQFADQHWTEAKWQDDLRQTAYYDTLSPYNCNCSPPYIPREEDQREYYENLGKYEHFFPGWDDWQSPSYDPENPANHRRQYVDMRIESNDNYDNADTLLGVAAATRILSVIQSFWLVRRDSHRESLSIEPMTFKGAGSGLRLKWSF